MIVAIDGPGGSGKSTVAQLLAARLGLMYVDTGAMYRTVTLLGLECGLDLRDGDAFGALAEAIDLSFETADEGVPRVLADGRDVGLAIRSPLVTAHVSEVSAHRQVRQALMHRQRELAHRAPSVLEGRDIGTVVCPDAEVKVFLVASLGERAKRRSLQFAEQGVTVDAERVRNDLETRDRYDSGRKVAPLRPAPDAVQIDTTALTIEQVVDRITKIVEENIEMKRGRHGSS